MLLDETKVETSDNGLVAQFSPKWEIWGPNGGYLAAIALRAAATVVPAGHRPASISCQFISPGKFAEARVTATPVKKGRAAWCIDVELSQGDRAILTAQVWTTDRLDGPRTLRAPMPRVARPEGLASYGELHRDKSPPHPYWRNFDVRPCRCPGRRVKKQYRHCRFGSATGTSLTGTSLQPTILSPITAAVSFRSTRCCGRRIGEAAPSASTISRQA